MKKICRYHQSSFPRIFAHLLSNFAQVKHFYGFMQVGVKSHSDIIQDSLDFAWIRSTNNLWTLWLYRIRTHVLKIQDEWVDDFDWANFVKYIIAKAFIQ